MPGLVIGSDLVATGSIYDVSLIASPPPSVGETSAVLQPATSPLFAGQSVSDTTDFAQMTNFANLTSSVGTVRAQEVSVSVLGDVADSSTFLNEGDMVRYQVTVTDDQGSAPAVFDTDIVTVEFAVRITSTAQNIVNIEVNPSIDPTALIDVDIAGLTAPDDIYNGTYAGTLAPGEPPFLLPGTFGLSHDGAGAQLDVGDTIILTPGLALFPTGTPNQTIMIRCGGEQIGAAGDLTHVLQAGDSIDLNGHILNWFDNTKNRLANLSVNGGEWHQWRGKVDLSGNITTGGTMRLDGAAQLFCGDMNVATNVLDIGIRSGRIANTGTWQGDFDLEVSLDAEAQLGIDTGTCTIDNGRTLTIIGKRCFVGFDGGSGGTSTLAFNAGATLSFKPMMRLPFVGGDTDVFVSGSTVTGGTSGFTGTIERIVWGTSTGTGWLWINTFSGVPTTGEDLVAIGTYKAQPIASGVHAQAGIPEFTMGKITEFRSGMFETNAPNVVANVDLTNAALEVDISGLAQGDYDLIDVDSLTDTLSSQSLDGASLAQVGNRLVLTVS